MKRCPHLRGDETIPLQSEHFSTVEVCGVAHPNRSSDSKRGKRLIWLSVMSVPQHQKLTARLPKPHRTTPEIIRVTLLLVSCVLNVLANSESVGENRRSSLLFDCCKYSHNTVGIDAYRQLLTASAEMSFPVIQIFSGFTLPICFPGSSSTLGHAYRFTWINRNAHKNT